MRRALHEAAIDLDGRKLELPQIAERGIARPEIVERDRTAQRHHLLKRIAGHAGVTQEDALGHFHLEPFGAQARRRQRLHHLGMEAGFEQLFGRDVDIDLDVFRPVARFLAGLAHDPAADRHDQPGILGERDELAGADEAVLCRIPAHQRLEAHQLFGVRVDHRLIVQHHLVAPQRGAQRDLELAAFLGRGVELRFEAAMFAPAHVLGLIERKVGVAHHLFDRAAIARAFGRTDAGADIERVVIDLIGLRQAVDHPPGKIGDHLGGARIADHDGEFVPAQTPDHLVLAHQRLQPRRNLREQLVAGHVAKRIVHRLETVEIDHQQRAAGAPLDSIAQRLAQRLGQLQAVGQLGERVVSGEIGDLLGGFALFGDVRADPAEAGEPAMFVAHRRARKLPPALLAQDRNLDQHVREVLAVLEPFGQIVEARRELAARPAVARDHLEQRLALDLGLRAAEREGEAR